MLEPYLIQQGFLMRTPRGRVATRTSWAHFGLQPPPDSGIRGQGPGTRGQAPDSGAGAPAPNGSAPAAPDLFGESP